MPAKLKPWTAERETEDDFIARVPAEVYFGVDENDPGVKGRIELTMAARNISRRAAFIIEASQYPPPGYAVPDQNALLELHSAVSKQADERLKSSVRNERSDNFNWDEIGESQDFKADIQWVMHNCAKPEDVCPNPPSGVAATLLVFARDNHAKFVEKAIPLMFKDDSGEDAEEKVRRDSKNQQLSLIRLLRDELASSC